MRKKRLHTEEEKRGRALRATKVTGSEKYNETKITQ
jgi:hypothetical protein